MTIDNDLPEIEGYNHNKENIFQNSDNENFEKELEKMKILEKENDKLKKELKSENLHKKLQSLENKENLDENS